MEELNLRDNSNVTRTSTGDLEQFFFKFKLNQLQTQTLLVEANANRQIYLQIFGEKKKTDLFLVKNSESTNDSFDLFSTTDNDLGKVNELF